MNSSNATLNQYNLPANINDFGSNTSAYKEMLQLWNWNLNGFTLASIIGNPWGSLYDVNRYFYFNPLLTPLSGAAPQTITWFANSGRIQTYFSTQPNSPYNLNSQQLMQLTDQGYLADVQGFENGFPLVPTACPSYDYSQPTTKWLPFLTNLQGPRSWQDEYCEYSVTRNEKGQITSVMFTCENPEYWYALWQVDPATVLSIYQSVINPNVQLEDLYLMDSDSKPVINPQTGQPAYNPLNKWNSGTVTTATSGGAMHLTSPPNTLGAEVYLAAAASLLRNPPNNASAQSMICCAKYGRPYRNSDPHIGFVSNQFASAGLTISLADPVGLYIQEPQFDSFNYKTPDQTPAASFWQVIRGNAPDQILHAVFSVPAEKGYTVSDITINNEPIQWASQIAATFQIALRAWGQQPDARTQPVQMPQPCPIYTSQPGAPALPSLLALMDANLLTAYNNLFTVDGQVANSPVMPAPILKQGATVTNLVLQLANVDATPEISFGPGIKVTATMLSNQTHAIRSTGRLGEIMSSAIFSLEIVVDVNAPVGQRDLIITDVGQLVAPAIASVLTIVSPDWPNE